MDKDSSRVLVIIQLLIRQPFYQPTIDNESRFINSWLPFTRPTVDVGELWHDENMFVSGPPPQGHARTPIQDVLKT